MKKQKYTIDDLVLGDEILFDDNNKIEHNLFWRVIHIISHSRVMVEIREMGFAEKFIVDIQDIIALQRSGIQIEKIS